MTKARTKNKEMTERKKKIKIMCNIALKKEYRNTFIGEIHMHVHKIDNGNHDGKKRKTR